MKLNIFNIFPIEIFVEENFLSPSQCKDIFGKIISERKEDHMLLHGDAKSSYMSGDSQGFLTKTNIPDLYQKLQERVDYYSNQCNIYPNKISFSWCNVQNKDSQLDMHAHGFSALSGVLYINVDDQSSTLDFLNPNYSIFQFNIDPKSYVFKLQPKIGTLIIFPSWLVHGNWGTNINKTENRAIISFNTRAI